MSDNSNISDVILVVGYNDTGESYHMKTWLANNNIDHTVLEYNTRESTEANIEILNQRLAMFSEEDPIDVPSFVMYKTDQVKKQVTVLYDSENRPLFDEDSEGNITIRHTIENVTMDKYITARSAQQLEDSSLLEDWLLGS